MEKFTSILDQFKQAENNDERFSAGMAGMTSILNGGSNILGKMKDLSAVKDSMQYDLQLNNMQDAGRQNFYTTDSFMQDALSRPSGFNVERNSLAQSGRNIASGMLGSTLQGASTGFELGGIWGGIAGAVAGLGASGLAAFKGRRDAHKAEDELRQREQEERRLMDNRYVMQADNVNNYMMNQAYAHRVAEGGKVQTTISMGDFAKKVLAKRPYAAGGQVNNPLGAFSTHGGFFSPGIIRVNEGGSHEENPYGGVQYGTDQQGIPNLVEQGENIWKDYVFSDRLKPSKKMLKEFNLPEKYYGMTFARISDKLSEEADSRPNDAVSKRGMDAMLARLEACQEQLKAEKAEREQAAMSMREAPLPEEMMMAQQPMMPQQMPQEDMMGQGMPMMEGAPMMAAYGGRVNTFAPGGWLNGLLSRYKENHVPENFQAYENDPYMYGEIDPSLIIGDRELPGAPVGLEMPWYTPAGAIGKIRSVANIAKAARAARGSKVAKSAKQAFSEFDDMISAAEKGAEAKKVKAAEKAAEKAAKEAAEKEAKRIADINKEVADRLAAEFETARTKTDVARQEYDAANIKMKQLAKKAGKSMSEEDIAAAKEARTILGSKYDALQEAQKAQELASLNNSEKAVARAQKEAIRNANKEMKAAERAASNTAPEQLAQPSGNASGESAPATSADDRSRLRRFWSGSENKHWYNPLGWGAWRLGLAGTGMRLLGYPAIQAVKEEINAKGKSEDTPTNPLPPVNSHAYGGNLFWPGGDLTPMRIGDIFWAGEPSDHSAYNTGYTHRDTYTGIPSLIDGRYTGRLNKVLSYPEDYYLSWLENHADDNIYSYHPAPGDPDYHPIPSYKYLNSEGRGDSYYDHSGMRDAIDGAGNSFAGDAGSVSAGTGVVSGKKPKAQLPVAPMLTDEQALASLGDLRFGMRDPLPRVDTKFLEGVPNSASLAREYAAKGNLAPMIGVGEQGGNGGNGDDSVKALPTWMRYSGALQSGLAALDSALRDPDYSLADSYKSMMRSAPHRQVAYRPQFVAPRYNPDDVNMMANQAAAMSTAGMRQMTNSGAGPSMMAVAPMMGYLSSQALGSAMAQGRLDNYQKYLQHINALNQINGQIAAGDMQAQSQNANLQEYANQFNAGMLDRYNQFRDAEDTARAAAISQNSSLAANNLANIGRENFSMNQIRSNPAFLGYGIGINGMLDYAKPAACGGKRKTKKK